jgi:sugar phosphate isomerase/epimerase
MNRREFSKLIGMSALAMQAFPGVAMAGNKGGTSAELPGVPLGVCDHALRAMNPTADDLVDYAIEHRLDALQLNTLRALENRGDDKYLARLKSRAAEHEIAWTVGVGSISENSTRFSTRYGNARETLLEGIRVSAALGSPIVVCRIGTIEDRYTEGGIEAHMEAVIKVMKSCREQVQDTGLKIAFENHAGDMRTDELLTVIEETGADVCGAMLDFGNAIWAMEDPKDTIEFLGSHILCVSARDVMLWPTEDGAIFQWTAIGQGLMDFPLYADLMARLCPGVPMQVETISNSPRPLPYLTDEFWKGFPDLNAADIVPFLKMLRRGHELGFLEPPGGVDQKAFDIQHQQSELAASLDYLREYCHAGLKGAV